MSRPPSLSRDSIASAARSMAGNAARTAATADSCPPIMASRISAGSQMSMSWKRGLGRSVFMITADYTLTPNALVFFQFCVFNSVVIMRGSRQDVLLLGVDGGGTRCRARLTSFDGSVLGEGVGGPAK